LVYNIHNIYIVYLSYAILCNNNRYNDTTAGTQAHGLYYYYHHYVIVTVIIVRRSQLTHDCARWFTTDLYEVCGVWPQGQSDARGVREQVAFQATAVDLPRDQVSGTVDLPGVPRHLGDYQHLLMDHRHFAQVPHFSCVRWVVIALQNENIVINLFIFQVYNNKSKPNTYKYMYISTNNNLI